MRAAVVNEKTLAQLAASIGLHECVRLGKGELQTGGEQKPSILSSTLEALIAAIYLDGGFNAVYPVVRHLFAPLFIEERELMAFYDHKTQLRKSFRPDGKSRRLIICSKTNGPDHAKTFEVEVRMNGTQARGRDGLLEKGSRAERRASAAIQTVD